MRFWLEHHPRFALHAKGLQVMGEGRTLGEFDVVFTDRATGQVHHLELAVKFYLAQQAQDGLRWIDPNGNDSLAAKLSKVHNKQLVLSDTAAGRSALAALGIDEVHPAVLMKGILFEPHTNFDATIGNLANLNPFRQRGKWCHLSALSKWI